MTYQIRSLCCPVAVSLWLIAFSLNSQVVINEIHYDPDVKTEPVEFIELYNAGGGAVNLSGWQFTDGVAYTFPNGTTLGAGGYLVIAQNPAALQSKFGVTALGPWAGKLSSSGEKITLQNAAGGTEDTVEYQLGFPWPTVGDAPGYSIELINPALDNDLGGNWRRSVSASVAQPTTLIPSNSTWNYFKGTSEASTPATAWRSSNFDDAGWFAGVGPIGYGETFLNTVLADMPNNYTTVFLRKSFVVSNVNAITSLTLAAQYDDGFKVWINGSNVLNAAMPAGEVPYNATATSTRESSAYVTFNLPAPGGYLVPGTNLIAVQAANVLLSGSSDFYFDAQLSTAPASAGPTPGRLNAAFATNAPPQIRQVDHSPNQPISGQAVTITAKITDPQGVASVSLQYQVVVSGSYIELTDAAYTNVANWVTLAMNDAGNNGDALAGDNIYTAVIPASVQQHRRLIRYRLAATDGVGSSLTVPYADDPQPNFAYFCYDGVPAWSGAARPGVTAAFTVSSNEMNRLPVYQLISKESSVLTATGWNPGAPNNKYGGDNYLWRGTLVYDGTVYDHISYRMRGGVWRYSMGKNAWKFALNRGHNFQARDDWGRKYNTLWRRLSFRPDIQQGDYLHRGEQGMFESCGYKLFRLAGVDAPLTTHVQFRIIDAATETTAGNQYQGDFWGLYLVVEEQDGRFLDERGLPDGNVYDMEGGSGTLNNTGPDGPLDKSDLNDFLTTYSTTSPSESWWRTNLNLPQYYGYQTILQGFHHYDIADGKNYFYYRNPVLGQWEVWPWDLDLTWADNMYVSGVSGGNEPFKSRVLSNFSTSPAYPALALEFRNRVREIRDLLFNTDQAYQVIDEMAERIRGPVNQPSIIDADRAQWDYNPVMVNSSVVNPSKAGQGRFYQWPESVSKDFNGCIQLMKNYVVYRSTVAALGGSSPGLDGLAADTIPATPTITYTGPTNFPLNQLSFQCSAYSGANPFAALKWRVGEVWDTNAPAYDAAGPRPYEINAQWESGEISVFANSITMPADALKIGRAYRARVRMKDNAGRWSHWSAPVQFVVGSPPAAVDLTNNLRLTELMFDPPAGGDYEFIEVRNISTNVTLDLAGANFTAGVNYTFATGTTLMPGAYLLVIKNASAATFRSYYNLSPDVPIVGPYTGSLANEGETLTLKTGAGGAAIFSFNYGNGRGWPVAPNGAGHSLVPVDPLAPGQATGALDYPGNWRASAFIGGSPGAADPVTPAPSVVLNEIVAHTDYTNASLPEYDSNDWIELYNPTAASIGLTNWYLSDDPANPAKWAIPPAMVPARGWVSFDEVTGFHNPITSGFGLNKAGEQVLLSYLPGGAADRVVDAIQFKGQPNGNSIGRYPDGGAYLFALNPTRATANTAGLPGLVITELMYHPPDLGTNDNTRDEFVEIYNPTASPITLQDADGNWRLDGGIAFTFPPTTTIPADGSLLVVSFPPTDTATLAAFRTAQGLTNLSLPILGPYAGKLSNRSDRVALERPQLPDAVGDSYSWIIVDEVIYGNQTSWPASANGGGHSLQRLSASASGNNPANWFAVVATPGTTAVNPDTDGDGMPNDWETAHGLNPSLNDAGLDPDHDGLTNWQEYLAGTDPQAGASFLAFTSVTVSNGAVNLSFIRVADRSYTIQYANLPVGPWQKLTDISSTTITGPVSVSDTAVTTNAARWYRLATPALP